MRRWYVSIPEILKYTKIYQSLQENYKNAIDNLGKVFPLNYSFKNVISKCLKEWRGLSFNCGWVFPWCYHPCQILRTSPRSIKHERVGTTLIRWIKKTIAIYGWENPRTKKAKRMSWLSCSWQQYNSRNFNNILNIYRTK